MPADPPMELGGEWLTEAEQRDKSSRNESWNSNQHELSFEQAKDLERLNDNSDPNWLLDDGDVPAGASLSDDENNASGDESIGSFTSCWGASEGVTCPQVSSLPPTQRPPRRPEPLPPPYVKPPRRSRRLGGEAAGLEKINGRCRPDTSYDYARCCTSMVTNRMKIKGFINANKAQFACTLGTKQPPRSARLSRKKKEYKARF